ncbi:MAG: response regulator [Chloroflexota bacterium]
MDDDRLVLSTLGDELKVRGYEVPLASSGEEGVRAAREQSPDLVVMDVRMPGMSGIEAARAIRESGGAPALFLSAFDERETVERAVAEGALGYLVKPVGANQLVPAIEAAIARAADLKKLAAAEENLRIALAGERAVSIAVGILMERHRLGAGEAFERLRRYARSRRRKINDVATEAVGSVELLAEICKNLQETSGASPESTGD